MTTTVAVHGVTRRYRDHRALDDVTVDVTGPSITGLLGRNGAGKSTLLRIVAGQEFPSSGTVDVLGRPVLERDAVLRHVAFVREDQVYPDVKVRDVVRAASWFHPRWDATVADDLLAAFELPLRRPVKKLSRGMRSALSITVGLAARAEVTLLDEPYAGLDAVARHLFYEHLLADFADHPRTIVLSTHLIDEASGLMDHIVLIDRGRIVLDAPADEVRGGATTVTGPSELVDRFVADRPTWGRRRLGGQASVTMVGPLDEIDRMRARDLHLRLEALSLQELVVRTTVTELEHERPRAGAHA